VCSVCLGEALKLNHNGALFDAVLIRLGGDTASDKAPASSEDSRNSEVGVLLACCVVGDWTIADYPICLSYCFLLPSVIQRFRRA
jgi:hypothetical protein